MFLSINGNYIVSLIITNRYPAMKTLKIVWFCLILSITNFSSIKAKVSLPSIFSNNMVLQRHATPWIWGTATAGKTIEITTSWDNKKYQITADQNGDWRLRVKTSNHGGPYSIRITEGNTILLENILIGDVWICSGQSNMEMPLAGWGKIDNYENEIAKANYPNIRLLQVEKAMAEKPTTTISVRNNQWDMCTPGNIADFSATAYFFAREVHEKTKIPIGLIHTSWGGTVAEAWMEKEALHPFPTLYSAAQAVYEGTVNPEWERAQKKFMEWSQTLLQKDAGYQNGMPLWATSGLATDDWEQMALPDTWENKGLVDFDGAVWFRKKVVLEKAWTQGDLYLVFTADDADIVWFNGRQIGATSGWNVQREYKIPKELIKEGEHTIAIRVFDTGGDGGVYTDTFHLRSEDGRTLNLSGKWDYKIGLQVKEVMERPSEEKGPNRPTVLYNGMIHPFKDYAIKGAIWYQGESNVARAVQYRTLFPALIECWRNAFQSPEMPFYFVQLASFMQRDSIPVNSPWALLREAQDMTAELPYTGMATAIDIGDALDIHPKNKQEVGRRLALWALAKDYKQKIVFSVPAFQSHKVEENTIKIRFTHAKGLHAMDHKPVMGFSIAGTDRKFYWAMAEIVGDEIVVRAPEVPHPVAVRYAWANNSDGNVYNGANLPALPFRTDSW